MSVPPGLSVVVPLLRADETVLAELRALCSEVERFDVSAEVILCGQPALEFAPGSVGLSVRSCWATAGFGPALLAGLTEARGEYVLTLDGESGGLAAAARALWSERHRAAVVVGSRHLSASKAEMTLARRLVSRAINKVFGRGLSIPVSDLSSPFKLYRAEVLRSQALNGRDYDLLPEILVRALAGGWSIHEIPLRVSLARRDRSPGPLVRLLAAYARTFASLWMLRNSIQAADYDARAYDSIIPLQRYWQRQRYRHVTELVRGEGPVLDVGCGSSRIMSALPAGSIGLDVLPNKLRYARQFTTRLVRGSGFHLPFADESFTCVLCSQVIEHVPMDAPILAELDRVLARGGRLVLGTPDYDRWEWVWMEKAYGFFKPGGYADEHISHYTRNGLIAHFTGQGYALEDTRYILRGELILAFRKTARPAPAPSVR